MRRKLGDGQRSLSNLIGWLALTSAFVLIAACDASEKIEDMISRTAAFPQPIVWVGTAPPQERESRTLLQALRIVEEQGREAGLTALERFVVEHLASPWTPSLRGHLAKYYREQGRFTLALEHWEAAWAATKQARGGEAKRIADATLAHWMRLLARLGRKDQLAELFKQIEGRTLDGGPLQQIVYGVHEALGTMEREPGISYRCGPYALDRVAGVLRGTNYDARLLRETKSPEGGFSLAALQGMAERLGLGLVTAARISGDTIPVPCVVHWRQDHYAAVVSRQGDLFEVVDPTFGYPQWRDSATINAEASGRFLIPRALLGQEWGLLASAEAATTFGKGFPNDIDDEDDFPCEAEDLCDCVPGHAAPGSSGGAGSGGAGSGGAGSGGAGSGGAGSGGAGGGGPGAPGGGAGGGGSGSGGGPGGGPGAGGGGVLPGAPPPCFNCHGMPIWRVSEPYTTVWWDDEPVGYQASRGPRVSFLVSYKQRDTRELNNAVFSVGVLSSFSWLSYVEDVSPNQATLFVPGGGQRTYKPDGVTPEFISNTRLLRQTNAPSGTLAGFRMTRANGSVSVYGLVPAAPVFGNARAYLTEKIDPAGNRLQLLYDTNAGLIRLRYVVDADGRTNTIDYFTSHPYSTNLVRQITDAYGRTATLAYDSGGHLTNILDAGGLSSSFGYDTNGWITNLTTPYGATAFRYVQAPPYTNSGHAYELGGDNIVNRAVNIALPNGGHELYLYRDNSTSFLPAGYSDSPALPPEISGLIDNNNLYYRNSFHWGLRQYENLSSAYLASNDVAQLSANDYRLARRRHWLHKRNLGAIAKVGNTLEMEQLPSPDNGGSTEGLRIWYGHTGKPQSNVEGTNAVDAMPTVVAWVQPDGSTAFAWTRYDAFRNPTNIVTTFSLCTSLLRRTNTFTWSADGVNLLTMRGPLGELLAGYSYNTNHNPVAFTNAAGYVTSLTYNPNQQVTSIVWPTVTPTNGLTTTNLYLTSDPFAGWLDRTINLEIAATNAFTWSNGLPLTHTDARGLTRSFAWDGLQRLISVGYPDATFESNRYARLDLVGARDRMSNWVLAAYNPIGQLMALTNRLTNVTRFGYCACGSLESVTNALLEVTRFSYDNVGRRLSTLLPDGATTLRYEYDLLDRLTAFTDGGSNRFTYGYHHHGLLHFASSAFGKALELDFDERDRLVRATDGDGVAAVYAHDNADRLLTRQVIGRGVELFGWSPRGLVVHTNAGGFRTLYSYDPAGRLFAETNALNEPMVYSNSPAGDLLRLIDAKGNIIRWEYDAFGRWLRKYDALNVLVQTNIYDLNHRRFARWSPAKGLTQYTYDAGDRLTFVDYPAATVPDPFQAADFALQYDALDRMTNGGGIAFTYTTNGQLNTEGPYWGNDTITNFYNAALQRSRSHLAQPSGGPWTNSFIYDVARRLTTLTSPAGAFGYDYRVRGLAGPGSLVRRLTLPNGLAMTNAYDAAGALTATALLNPWGRVLDGYSYLHDIQGRRTNTVRNVGFAKTVHAFAYDGIDQLTNSTAAETNGTARAHEQFAYRYDGAHNLTNRTLGSHQQYWSVNAANEPTNATRSGSLPLGGNSGRLAQSVTVNGSGATIYQDYSYSRTLSLNNGTNSWTIVASSPGASTSNQTAVLPATVSYQYDANGNLTGDASCVYSYDTENRLRQIYYVGVGYSTFTYDVFGRLRGRGEWQGTGDPPTLLSAAAYVYDGVLVVQERDQNNVVQVTYTRGLDLSGTMAGAGGIGGLLARTAGTNHAYYHADGGGNVTALTDYEGSVVARYHYDPFGRLIYKLGPLADANVYRFSSKEQHVRSGLSYFGGRFYDAALQRWITRDPLGEAGGVILYGFVENDPVDDVDPTGERPQRPVIYRNALPELFLPLSGPLPPVVTVGPGPPISQGSGVADGPSRPFRNPSTRDGLMLGSDSLGGPLAERQADFNATLIQPFLPLPCVNGATAAENAMARGIASEARVLQDMGLAKNTAGVTTAEGRAVPDALTKTLSVEVKDTASVSLTRQLRIETGAAADAGRQSVLVTGRNTTVSGPAKEAFDQIIRRTDLGPP
jgi:RHS repeat-associated protein